MPTESAIVSEVEPFIDGRHARGARSREAVVDAMLDLLNEGVARPTAEQISQRSGVSVRSIFRHFDDIETLYATAVARHLERVGSLFVMPTVEGDLDERVLVLVRRRAELFETITPVRRAAERWRDRSEVIRQRLEIARRTLRKHLVVIFEPELDELDKDERAEVIDALEVATAWRTWDTLRDGQSCSRRRATAVMARTVHGILDGLGSR
jgi:AcrR family transcriptional regulator